MGCDGGTIPKRDELVRKKKKEEKASKEDSRNVKWKNCALSHSTLEKPIVACELGRIFNKEAIINFLIQKKSSPESVNALFSEYIRNLKDVKELKLTPNPAYKDGAEKAGQSQKEAQFICPITGLEMNGCYRFNFLWTCGCVFSERGLKEIKDGVCVECNQPYTDDDIIPINPAEEEMDGLNDKMKERRAKNGTKNKKKRQQPEATETTATKEESVEPACKVAKSEKSSDPEPVPGPSKQPIGAKTGQSKVGSTSQSKAGSTSQSKTSKSQAKGAAGQSKESKLKKPQTIQDDPNASEVYKSLFTSHHTSINQVKAHWVTFNPFYF